MNHTTHPAAAVTACDWPWPDIKAAVEKAGKSLSEISVSVGKSPSAAWRVKNFPLPTLQSAIAAAIGVPPQQIWPSRYTQNGFPIRRRNWLQQQSEKRQKA